MCRQQRDSLLKAGALNLIHKTVLRGRTRALLLRTQLMES